MNNNPKLSIGELKIVKLNSEVEIHKALNEINHAHNPPLREKIQNLQEYANKLFQYAEVYIIKKKEMLGMIAFYVNDLKSKIAYITQIAVKPKYQNMSIGKKLIEMCFEVSYQKGMREVKLEVSKNNEIAIRFYIKYGFELFGNAKEHSIYMIKRL